MILRGDVCEWGGDERKRKKVKKKMEVERIYFSRPQTHSLLYFPPLYTLSIASSTQLFRYWHTQMCMHTYAQKYTGIICKYMGTDHTHTHRSTEGLRWTSCAILLCCVFVGNNTKKYYSIMLLTCVYSEFWLFHHRKYMHFMHMHMRVYIMYVGMFVWVWVCIFSASESRFMLPFIYCY